MRRLELLSAIHKTGLLTVANLYGLAASVHKYGLNAAALLGFAASAHGGDVALIDDHEKLTYREILTQVKILARILRTDHGLTRGRKAALLCRNRIDLVRAFFAVSLAGADVYLLNPDMSADQLKRLAARHDFDILIHDASCVGLADGAGYKNRMLPAERTAALIRAGGAEKGRLRRASGGKIVLLTGGTTGDFKEAEHKPSAFGYIDSFVSMVTMMRLAECDTAYVATPVCHGSGLALMLIFLALGKKVVISGHFDAARACGLVRENAADCACVVPLMINRMLRQSETDLRSLKCVVCGGAELNPKLAAEILDRLGDVLYNGYGTTECGILTIATPEDLRSAADTIGRKISGIDLKILDDTGTVADEGVTGHICVRRGRSKWHDTGDLGCSDGRGLYFWRGRSDDMIVSAGENVYPSELQAVLLRHPQIEDCAVTGMPDEIFGQRLKAFVLPFSNADLTVTELLEWLKPRVARYQMPGKIVMTDELPYTPLGKPDKKRLASATSPAQGRET